ncbi:hypothetical protein [Massilia sp. CF038]|uniref:hypothetical protein n=1 Tax=Massilia sp. CF038 TaxID=1881045 RepID=UPI000918989C|nr:hypothetical protein [Massilia sp. CF038]SHG60822.1 hypothetical protein SAMN05428948_1261 [Massilia sp. CF038]
MKRENAEYLTKAFLQISADLNAITYDYREDCGEADPEYLKFRKSVGQVLGTFYMDIMMRVFKDFPDLEPEELRDCDEDGADSEDQERARGGLSVDGPKEIDL